ncbi:mitochondrial amidoxime reducing component 2-like [Physella acuta]|uniref:mitochondrial amidoxime reducing component 2-like n=1 Tax=Physella acuta TaxID=109671 RepID=UPI0027DE2464|nr:mitochondrial amidoxime reducing component 2-like [Physella acuta]
MVQWSSFTNSRYLTLAATAVTAIAASVYFTMKKKKKVYELVGEVSGLYCYPIKSCAGIKGDVAFCSSTGLVVSGVKDRHFLIVRPNGDFITQRQIAKMASIKTSVDGQDLILDADGMASLKVSLSPKLDESKIIHCRIWKSTLDAQDCGEEASSWISSVLGEEGLKLVVFIPGLSKRQSSTKNALAKDKVAFPDESPYHLATEESLADLNSRIEKSSSGEITVNNFRPNILIKGTKEAWDEDNWSYLKIGESEMRVLAPCDRCILTTVDPNKNERREDGEPLKTLRSFRIFSEVSSTAPLFGIFAAVDMENSIKVGDPVYAVRN